MRRSDPLAFKSHEFSPEAVIQGHRAGFHFFVFGGSGQHFGACGDTGLALFARDFFNQEPNPFDDTGTRPRPAHAVLNDISFLVFLAELARGLEVGAAWLDRFAWSLANCNP